MEEIKSDTFGDLLSGQSERQEDFQFGTVSEILTVSSSWQSDNEHVEAEKVGVLTKKVACNDFKPVKVKKVQRSSKRIHKSFVTPNKFAVLEHENPDMNETDLHHVGLGSKVFQKSISDIAWKTVVRSKKGDRSNKCSKFELNSLKKFESRSPFGLLENILEENADGVLKRLNEIEFIYSYFIHY